MIFSNYDQCSKLKTAYCKVPDFVALEISFRNVSRKHMNDGINNTNNEFEVLLMFKRSNGCNVINLRQDFLILMNLEILNTCKHGHILITKDEYSEFLNDINCICFCFIQCTMYRNTTQATTYCCTPNETSNKTKKRNVPCSHTFTKYYQWYLPYIMIYFSHCFFLSYIDSKISTL